jgi:hypothetical protein
MSRYLLGGVLLAIVLGALIGIREGNGWVNDSVRASRNAVSANSAAASNLTPLESAGQNVQRQSQTGAVGDATGDTTPGATGDTTPTEETNGAADPAETPTPATPAQDPIPALW